MSQALSPVSGKPYGLAGVCRVWRLARSGIYRHQSPPPAKPPRRRGPMGAMSDEALTGAIRAVLTASPFHGEGHRKVWARLRFTGTRTSLRRVLRPMRENGLLAPGRFGSPRGPRNHDGNILPETVDMMWGTDLTTTYTGEGSAAVFIAVDHGSAECVSIHAHTRATRFEALESMRQGVRRHFGRFAKDIAHGLAVRHDHGSQVWTARGVQGDAKEIWRRCDCGHVSGLRTRHYCRWPRWVPRMTSEQYIGMELPAIRAGFLSFVGSTDRHTLQTRLNPWHQCEAQAALG